MQLHLRKAIAVVASLGAGLGAGALAVPAQGLADTARTETVPAWARYNVSFDGTAVYQIEGTTRTRTEKIDATLLRFSPKARRAIRRAGGLRLVISAKAPGGHAARSRIIKLRLRHR
ncbi:MAG: hypothetical protein ACXVSF_11985 [Solirubrobacteraceae bacterium]